MCLKYFFDGSVKTNVTLEISVYKNRSSYKTYGILTFRNIITLSKTSLLGEREVNEQVDLMLNDL